MSASATSASPPSALGRYFEISLYLLLLVSVLSLVSTGKLDLVSILVPPAALLVKGYRWWRGRGAELSQRAATVLVIGYFGFFPIDLGWVSRTLASGAEDPRLFAALLATIHLMLYAMIVRLYSARGTRDYLFLAMLAFSAMLASAILTVDTAFLGFLLLFLALGVSTFVGLEMRRSSEDATMPPVEPGTPAARRLHRALGTTSAVIAVASLVVGSVIFFVIPRVNAGYLSSFGLQPSLITGFSDDVELGQIGEIKKSSAVVMRIKIDGDPALGDGVHWRGVALTTFDGRRWYTEAHETMAMSQGADGWVSLDPQSQPCVTAQCPAPGLAAFETPSSADRRYTTTLQYTVFLEPIGSDALFVAAEPQRIRGQFAAYQPQAAPPGFGGLGVGPAMRRTYLVVDKTGSLSNPFHNFVNVRYDAVSDLLRLPPEVLRASSTAYPQPIRAAYLQLPKLDPRIPALARQIASGARNPYDKAMAVEEYLKAHYAYTLDLSGPPPADPVANFLFTKRAGHCEYFAAAMTVMMRSLGVPARYVNGFLPGEYNDLGGDYIIRASDAHSWVEIFFPGHGWITFDPTPGSDEQQSGFLSSLGNYWDWFQLEWGEWVINYDFFHQYTLAQGFQHTSRNWRAEFNEKFTKARDAGTARVRSAEERLAAIPIWVLLLIAAVPGALLCVRASPIRDRLSLTWRLRLGRRSVPQAASLSYRRMLELLERHGWPKRPAQTPLEFASALPVGELTVSVTQMTQLYLAARFGGQNADAARFAELLAHIREAVRNASPSN